MVLYLIAISVEKAYHLIPHIIILSIQSCYDCRYFTLETLHLLLGNKVLSLIVYTRIKKLCAAIPNYVLGSDGFFLISLAIITNAIVD